MPRPDFQVDHIEPNGIVVGTNCGDDVPIGTVFTTVEKIRIDGDTPNLTTVELGKVASINLALMEVHWSRRTIEAIPRGHSAGLRLEGDGVAQVLEVLRTKQPREYVHIRG